MDNNRDSSCVCLLVFEIIFCSGDSPRRGALMGPGDPGGQGRCRTHVSRVHTFVAGRRLLVAPLPLHPLCPEAADGSRELGCSQASVRGFSEVSLGADICCQEPGVGARRASGSGGAPGVWVRQENWT